LQEDPHKKFCRFRKRSFGHFSTASLEAILQTKSVETQNILVLVHIRIQTSIQITDNRNQMFGSQIIAKPIEFKFPAIIKIRNAPGIAIRHNNFNNSLKMKSDSQT